MDARQPSTQDPTTKKLKQHKFAVKRWLTIILVVMCVIVSWFGVIDELTEDYVDGALKQAIVAYAGARTINAGISLMQSGEIGGNLFFANTNIRPFESLDPLDDMVEDYATAMKYAIGSLVIQELLVEVLSNNIFKWLITLSAFLLIASLLLFNGLYTSHLLKCFLFVALVRFLFVTTIFISGQIDDSFVNEKTKTELVKVKAADAILAPLVDSSSKASAQVQSILKEISELNKKIGEQSKVVGVAKLGLLNARRSLESIEDNLSFWEKHKPFSNNQDLKEARNAVSVEEDNLKKQEGELKKIVDELETKRESMDELDRKLNGEESLFEKAKSTGAMLKNLRFEDVKKTIEGTIESMLRLIGIFVFKTLLMPLTFLLLLLRTFKAVWGIDPRSLVGEPFPRANKARRLQES